MVTTALWQSPTISSANAHDGASNDKSDEPGQCLRWFTFILESSDGRVRHAEEDHLGNV